MKKKDIEGIMDIFGMDPVWGNVKKGEDPEPEGGEKKEKEEPSKPPEEKGSNQ